MGFNNKVAIVTGAASGIGLGIAKALVQRGAIVALVDIDEERLVSAVQGMSGNFRTYVADVTNFNQIRLVFNEVFGAFGSLDIVFNNAGIGGTLPFEEATMADWKKIVDLNLYGVINGVTAAYPIMKRQQSGYIVNTSSIAGLIPFGGQTLYNTTKFAVTGLSLTVSAELKKENICLSVVCPGMVRTRIFNKPIIGDEVSDDKVTVPQEAISVDEAVRDIMEGIGKKRRIIITPKSLRRYYLWYRLRGSL